MITINIEPQPDRLYAEARFDGKLFVGTLIEKRRQGDVHVFLYDDRDNDNIKDADEPAINGDISIAGKTQSTVKGETIFTDLEPGLHELVFRDKKIKVNVEADKTTVATIGYYTAPPTPAPKAKIKLTKPFVGSIKVENTIFDCSGVQRVFTQLRNSEVQAINCDFLDAVSVVEEDTSNAKLTFKRCTTNKTIRYTIYVGGLDANKKYIFNAITNYVTIDACNFGSSEYEHPIRVMPGTDIRCTNTTILDTVDLGGKKINSGLRNHATKSYFANCTLGLSVKVGASGDNADEIQDSSEFVNCNFKGPLILQKGIRTLSIVGGGIDVTANPANLPYAISKIYDGIAKDINGSININLDSIVGKTGIPIKVKGKAMP